jgi:hypothetical protein
MVGAFLAAMVYRMTNSDEYLEGAVGEYQPLLAGHVDQ